MSPLIERLSPKATKRIKSFLFGGRKSLPSFLFSPESLTHFNSKKLSETAKKLLTREKAVFDRRNARRLFRKNNEKNILSAWGDPKYRELLSKQSGTYINEYVSDISHPIQTVKRQLKQVSKGYDPQTKTLYRRTPMGKGFMGATLFGIPLMIGASEIMNNDPSIPPAEKIIRGVSGSLPDLLSPKAIPSVLAYQVPDLIFGKRVSHTNPKKEIQNITLEQLQEIINTLGYQSQGSLYGN